MTKKKRETVTGLELTPEAARALNRATDVTGLKKNKLVERLLSFYAELHPDMQVTVVTALSADAKERLATMMLEGIAKGNLSAMNPQQAKGMKFDGPLLTEGGGDAAEDEARSPDAEGRRGRPRK